MDSTPHRTPMRDSPGWFSTTHWSVVLAAGTEWCASAQQALEGLCRTYWRPVHEFVRRWGHAPHDAEDLTQQFFAQFIEKEHYRLADRQRGKFRTFLLAAVKSFLINERERACAQKRGGGMHHLSLSPDAAGNGLPAIEPADERTADRIYLQNWALTLLEHVQRRLEQEYVVDGKAGRFALLEKLLPGEDCKMTYAQAAAQLGVAEGTIKSDMHRLKRRYRELLREEIANTVAAPGEVDEELRYLIAVVGEKRG